MGLGVQAETTYITLTVKNVLFTAVYECYSTQPSDLERHGRIV